MSADVGDDALDIALKVAAALTSVGAEYFLGGSLASSIQGEPRATNDIDFVIALPAGKIGALRDALGADFEVDTDMLRDAVLHAGCANVFYLPVVTKIDLFGRAYEPFDDSEFSRRRSVVVRPGASLIIKSPEDTVLRKLLRSSSAYIAPASTRRSYPPEVPRSAATQRRNDRSLQCVKPCGAFHNFSDSYCRQCEVRVLADVRARVLEHALVPSTQDLRKYVGVDEGLIHVASEGRAPEQPSRRRRRHPSEQAHPRTAR
jgi:hypothetical protein